MSKISHENLASINLYRTIRKFARTRNYVTPELVWVHVSSYKSLKDFVTSQARGKCEILEFIWSRTNKALSKREWDFETQLATRKKKPDIPKGPSSGSPLSRDDDEEDNLFKLFGID